MIVCGSQAFLGLVTVKAHAVNCAFTLLIMIIVTYIYNTLNDALSSSRIHNKLKMILSKYIHIQKRQS